jgi:CheY-like chemotaxis protein
MQQAVSARAPAHLWIIGFLSLLWNCFGAYDYTMTKTRGADYIASTMPGVDASAALAWIEGMPAEVVERVFEPFFTTKSYGEGTGLGLSQVFGFAKQIGAAVTVESTPGEGSTFTLFLPVTRGAIAGDAKVDSEHSLGRVLVVEDDSLVAELAAGMLDELGFEAVVTHSAKEALQRLSGEQRPTVVFSDIVMPGGISGIELARKIRDRFPELPVLLTSGYSEKVTATEGFPLLQKPYDMEALAAALGALLKQEIAVS